jgi:hypothetical protein
MAIVYNTYGSGQYPITSVSSGTGQLFRESVACEECGALHYDVAKHTKWHADLKRLRPIRYLRPTDPQDAA